MSNFAKSMLLLAALATTNVWASSDNTFVVGADVAASFKYEEPGLMKETGTLYGLYGRWERSNVGPGTVAVSASYLAGGLDYEGSTQSGIPVKSNTDDFITEIVATYGWDFRGPVYEQRPYIGLGYRYWNDRIKDSATSTGVPVFGYEREVSYLYAPLGIRFNGGLASNWTWATRVQYKYFIEGQVRTHLEDVDPGFNTLENKQSSGYGYDIAATFMRLFGGGGVKGLAIEPYYSYWSIKQSDNATVTYYGTPVGYGYEPKNNTKVLGLRVGAQF